MRVITGLYKGRRLSTVRNHSVRPAADRVKQTIFDVLATRIDLEGSIVLDLFAGSGSLGIEALSRAARRVDFVETIDEAADCIEQNLIALGCKHSAQVYRMDARRFVHEARDPYNLIFADPPYAYPHTAELPELFFSRGLLFPQGYLLIEHSSDVVFHSSGGYTMGPEKKFGRTVVTFFSHIASNKS